MSAAVDTPPLPPSYSGPIIGVENLNVDELDVAPSALELPAYTPSRLAATPRRAGVRQLEPKEFSHELKKKGKPFAVLTIIAEGTYSKQIPTLIEGIPVKGMVRLTLDKPDAIQSVVVSVTGQVITGPNEDDLLTFVNVSHTLWSLSEGEPKNTNSDGGISSPACNSPNFSGKLQGNYAWPFSIDLPKEVFLPIGPRKEPQVFNLPQTFNEQFARVAVSYEVSVRFNRGKLRTDHRIHAPVGYISRTCPPPFPELRRLAYEQGTPLLGPTIDPDGWMATESVQIQGTTNNHVVQVGCTLFLAKPLSYTRGSLIPFCLRLECADKQALDLLSTPKAIVLRLKRRVKYQWNIEKDIKTSTTKNFIDHSQLPVWWPSTEGSEAGGHTRLRFMNGELHLRPEVKPSCVMAHFRIEYFLVLFPFDSPDFVSTETAILINYPVDIAGSYAPGPRPMKFAPPGYESDTAT